MIAFPIFSCNLAAAIQLITQQDLADMSEIAISAIKKIESGKGNPSLSTVEKIMDILGMEVKYEIRQTV